MKFQELVILLPCHSLEDFPVYSEGEEAQGLLAAWTSLWHPALVHSAQSMPTWARMDDPPTEVEGRLLVIPPVSHTELPTGFRQRVKESGGLPIRKKQSRDEILETALAALDDAPEFDPEWVQDFLALGFAYLQVQILTRQMRYSSNLDEVHFANQVVAAVNAAAEQNTELAEEKLTACFDLLSEERDIFYSVDSFLIDLVMLTPATLGAAFMSELQANSPVNFLLSAGVLEALQTPEKAEACAALRQAWQEGRVGLIACDHGETPLPLMSMESLATAVDAGLKQVEAVLGQSPRVYGRRRFGLTPHLPQVLQKCGVHCALHATLEEGRFPEAAQIKSQWEGADGTTIEAIAKAPLNASLPETFLGLALKTGESMDMDHVATLCLAHWPGAASPLLNDLRRAARRTTALGSFITVEKYFKETDEPHHSEKFPASLARSPYLRQAIVRRQEAPLSRWVRYHQARSRLAAAASLHHLAALVARAEPGAEAGAVADSLAAGAELDQKCETQSLDQADAALKAAKESLGNAATEVAAALRLPSGEGKLILNPHTSVRRTLVSLEGFASLPQPGGGVYAIEQVDGDMQAVVDVPPMGYLHLAPGGGDVDRREPLLAEGLQLRNEFFEVLINEATGGIASVQSYTIRGNRMSQQLALRMSGKVGERAMYSQMVCDDYRVLETSRLTGVIRTSGRLIHHDETVATFQQTVRVTRGSRVLELDVELDNITELKSDPWNCYVANRLAWKDESSGIACDLNQARASMGDRKRLEAMHYVDIRNGAESLTVFPDGLPFHRRVGLSSLDTILAVRNEPVKSFKLGLGVDLQHPLQEALGRAAPPAMADGSYAAPEPASAWLFRLQAKNVVATSWRPLGAEAEGHLEVRLLETAGRSAQVKLQSFRSIASAWTVDLSGNKRSECEVQDGAVALELGPRQWSLLRLEWGG